MDIILKISPIRRFVNGKRQRETTKIVKPSELTDYGFTEAQIKRISDEWDVNHISRRDSQFAYKASPKY